VQAIKQLEESEFRFRTLIENASVATAFYSGPEIRIEYANAMMLGFWDKGADILGLPFEDAIPELKDQPFLGYLKKVYETGEAYVGTEEEAWLKADGELKPFYFNFAYKALRDTKGTIYGIHHMAIDVTDTVLARRSIEQGKAHLELAVAERTHELEMLNTALQRSNQYLETFAHAASHDLKEPIRKIQYFTNRLKDQLTNRLGPDLPEAITMEKIFKASNRMNALIEDLLSYSFVSEKPLQQDTVNLEQLIQQVQDDLEVDMEAKQGTLTIGALPTIAGYARQLDQLFQNLLSNSLKYSKADTPPVITVMAQVLKGDQLGIPTTAVKKEQSYVVISFADNGIGFDMEDAERIFNMFQRLHGNAEYSGTGIGLAIVKKVAENHSGYVWAVSTPDQGATFFIALPA
jgi:PAS domain S-box-containing protein